MLITKWLDHGPDPKVKSEDQKYHRLEIKVNIRAAETTEKVVEQSLKEKQKEKQLIVILVNQVNSNVIDTKVGNHGTAPKNPKSQREIEDTLIEPTINNQCYH